jgi:diguanylate cyclase (GGDEF)-like protein
MLDVDCFKEFNDDHGFAAGDDCLRAIIQAVRSRVHRSSDLVARHGGGEIALILPDTDEAGAIEVCGQILQLVRDLAIPHPTSKLASRIVTLSIGYVTTVPSGDGSPFMFLHQAGLALYDAKRRGRNRMMCFTSLYSLLTPVEA